MNNKVNGKDMMSFILKAIFGELPAQWIRFVLLGVGLTLLWKGAMDFKQEIKAEATSVRIALEGYIQSNKVWQETNIEERQRLLRKANARFHRLYQLQGWDYEDLEQ